MPNLMFTGPAGVGKTTTAIALVKAILGEYWRQNFLELNAQMQEERYCKKYIKKFLQIKTCSNAPLE